MEFVCLWNQFVAPVVLKLSQHAAERFSLGEEKKNTASNFFYDKSVLQKWRNKSPRRFHPPVANRVQKIREPPQHHIPTDDDPNWAPDLQLVHLQVNYGDLQRSPGPSGQRSTTEDRRLCPQQVVRGKHAGDAPDERASNNEEIHHLREEITRSSRFCQML